MCGFSGEPARFLRTPGQDASAEQLRSAVIGTEDPSLSKGEQVNRGRREGSVSLFRPTPSDDVLGTFIEVRVQMKGCREGLARKG